MPLSVFGNSSPLRDKVKTFTHPYLFKNHTQGSILLNLILKKKHTHEKSIRK